MRDKRLMLDEVLVVFRVVPRVLVIIARELLDCGHGLPQRREDKVRVSSFGAAQYGTPRFPGVAR